MKRTELRAAALRPAKKDVARIAGLPAVAALFKAAPERVERLFFEERARASVAPFCAALARIHKPFRLVGSDELDRIAGTLLHGGIAAIARPQTIHPFDPQAATHPSARPRARDTTGERPTAAPHPRWGEQPA